MDVILSTEAHVRTRNAPSFITEVTIELAGILLGICWPSILFLALCTSLEAWT